MSLLLQCELRRRFYINDRTPVIPKSLFALNASEMETLVYDKRETGLHIRRAHIMTEYKY